MAKRKAATKTATKKPAPRKGAKAKGAPSANRAVNWTQQSKQLGKRWKERRGKQRGGDFDNLPINSGEFYGRLTGASIASYKSGNKKGQPYLKLSFTAFFGEADGSSFTVNNDLNDEEAFTDKDGEPVLNIDLIDKNLQALGIETSEMDWEELPEVCAHLTAEKPYVELYCQNKQKNSKGSYEKTEEYGSRKDDYVQNYYINDVKTREQMEVIASEYGESLPDN